jgi:3-hydroxyacyl-CoA dehydrogenase
MTRPSARPDILRSAHADPTPACVGIVGAGIMGGAIARLLCAKGIAVRLVDPSDDALVRVRKALADDLDRKSRSGDLGRPEARRRLLLLAVSTTPSGLSGADLVIEAVPERADLKRDVLATLAASIGPSTIVASNTSSFPVRDLAAWFPDPTRLVGLHFFNPVDKLPLVEIIRGAGTSDAAVRSAAKVAMELGKTPIVVGDGPGFLVNRLFTPYLRAACTSVLDGTPMKRIDDAVEAWGLAMGPFRMMDMIGLDVLDDVGRNLATRGLEGSHPLLTALLARGFKGRKTGRGFYVWKGNAPTPNPALPELAGRPTTESPAAVASRLLGVLAEEARSALTDGTVGSKDDLDLASILGMGFPAWRGGLAHALLGDGA